MLFCSVAIVKITESVNRSYRMSFLLKKLSNSATSIVVPFHGIGFAIYPGVGPGGLGNGESGLMTNGGKVIGLCIYLSIP